MRKLVLVITALCTVLIGAGAANPVAAYPPGAQVVLDLDLKIGPPGFAFNAVVRGCFPGESVDFRFNNGAPVRAICDSTTFQALASFVAPTEVGSYSLTATLLGGVPGQQSSRPLVLTDGVTVVEQTSPTTTVAADGNLPQTGSSGISGNLTIAGTALVVGLGLLAVAGVRRRQRHATPTTPSA
jgi:LPXTG-motif cell wall-anchored protein